MKKNGKKKPQRRAKTDAERRKLTLIRRADTDAANQYSLGGREKPAARKPSLASKETLRKLDRDKDEWDE